MRRFPAWLIMLIGTWNLPGTCLLYAHPQGDVSVAPETATNEAVEVPLDLGERVWFTDVVATAIIQFPDVVEEPRSLPLDDDVTLIGMEIRPTQDPKDNGCQAVIRFLPRRSGLTVFPSLQFFSETRTYRSPPTPFVVSVPGRTAEMQFDLQPNTTTVYVGQPLRIDVTWSSQHPANRIRSLRCFPEIFNHDDVQIVIPRCTAPEQQQMGLPFGGRRIIAQRVSPTDDATIFGTVSFSMFLRFGRPGKVEIPATRLEYALLRGQGSAFAPYAAYYNNGLFEPLSSLNSYDRVFAESQSALIDVVPLPSKDRTELFSGLFSPCTIDVSTSVNELPVGQVLEIDLRVRSDAPHGMLDLQPLNLQRSLRGRFYVSEKLGRTWYPDGTGFRARVRPLTTKIVAFPSLQIPVFDAKLGTYRNLQTSTVPLKVGSDNGRDYFDISTLVSQHTLTDHAEGIWHNAQPSSLSNVLNSVTGLLADHFELWILGGLVLFALLMPWVLERRRRATNPRYCRLVTAYHDFRAQPEGTKQKWAAFQRLLSAGFSIPTQGWTSGDARQRLHSIDVSDQDIATILKTHDMVDQSGFSSKKREPSVPELNALAGRLFTRFRCMPNLLFMALVTCSGFAAASERDQAALLYQQALDSTPGLPETESLYVQSALRFESAARQESPRGVSWYDAGNAWFKAGQLGRAIACYRQAQIYRPFDNQLRDNLKAARALTVDVLDHRGSIDMRSLPVRWICALMVPAVFLSLASLLIHIRFRSSLTLVVSITWIAVTLIVALMGHCAWSHSGSEGVVIVGEIYGRKGPAYSYQPAFNEPLHDGLEFHVRSRQNLWLQIELSDGRRCWIPEDQTRLIFNRRT